MGNGIVLYESRYGAAKQYAEWIAEGLKLPLKQTKDIAGWELAEYDLVIAGSSIYMGKVLIHDWLVKNEAELNNKKLLLFIVGAAPPTEKSKTEKYFTNNVPPALLKPGNHFYLQGKSVYSELRLADKFFLKVGAWLAKKPEDKKAMRTDFNAVKRESLFPLLNATNKLFCQQVKDGKSKASYSAPA